MAGGHAWWGACMVGGMHDRGTHDGGGMHGRGHEYQGACMAGGVHGRGACVAGGMHDRGASMVIRSMHGRRHSHCSGRYASYWNAFLF